MAPAGDRHQGFGFFSVIHSDDGGISGGLLVLNASGRPLEFHCTAVVKPSRPQQILYGPTLLPYLVGEQIGPTLIAKAKSPIEMVFTDAECSYSMRQAINTPLVYVTCTDSDSPAIAESPQDRFLSTETESTQDRRWRIDSSHKDRAAPHWKRFTHEELSMGIHVEYEEDQRQFTEMSGALLRYLDFAEPFSRVREAVAETIGTGRG